MAELQMQGIALDYPVYGARARSAAAGAGTATTGAEIRRGRRGRVDVAALDGVTLEARDGDRIGILGRNGAGKTTLLKVAAGIFKPSRGSIRRVGRTIAIFNASIGLDPGLTGYDNIEQIALLYGLGRREAARLRPDIEEFTELGEFLSMPVETYSAGMQTRLAFAVATAFHPEILVADENIGTGDAGFVAKAQDRMRAMMDRTSLLLLATHSMATIRKLCNRAILMQRGRIVADGGVEEVVARYQSLTPSKAAVGKVAVRGPTQHGNLQPS